MNPTTAYISFDNSEPEAWIETEVSEDRTQHFEVGDVVTFCNGKTDTILSATYVPPHEGRRGHCFLGCRNLGGTWGLDGSFYPWRESCELDIVKVRRKVAPIAPALTVPLPESSLGSVYELRDGRLAHFTAIRGGHRILDILRPGARQEGGDFVMLHTDGTGRGTSRNTKDRDAIRLISHI